MAAGFAATGASRSPDPTPSASAPPVVAPEPSPPPAPTVAAVRQGSVPGVAGLALADARSALERAGFVAGDATPQDSSTAAGIVLGSTPAVGETAPLGSTVALTVASGSNAVPAVVGLTEDEASGLIAAAGFVPQIGRGLAGPGALVSATSLESGQVVPLGTVVTILLARSTPATPTPTPQPTSTAPAPTPTSSVTPAP